MSRAYDDPERGDRAAAILALVGVINLPIIKFSVDWWNTLHQPASVMKLGGPSIDPSILMPLLVMAVAFLLLFVLLVLLRTETEIDRRRLEVAECSAGAGMNNYAVFILSAYLAALRRSWAG